MVVYFAALMVLVLIAIGTKTNAIVTVSIIAVLLLAIVIFLVIKKMNRLNSCIRIVAGGISFSIVVIQVLQTAGISHLEVVFAAMIAHLAMTAYSLAFDYGSFQADHFFNAISFIVNLLSAVSAGKSTVGGYAGWDTGASYGWVLTVVSVSANWRDGYDVVAWLYDKASYVTKFLKHSPGPWRLLRSWRGGPAKTIKLQMTRSKIASQGQVYSVINFQTRFRVLVVCWVIAVLCDR
jgi:hypothetical protein